MNSKRMRRTGTLAAGAVALALLGLPGPASAGQSNPDCVNLAPTSDWTGASQGYTAWGTSSVVGLCNPNGAFDGIGRRWG
jgi:hypothetical protein